MPPADGQPRGAQLVDLAAAQLRGRHSLTAIALDAEGRVWTWTGPNWASRDWQKSPSGKLGPASAIAARSYDDETPAIFAVASGRVHFRVFAYLGRSTWRDMDVPAAPIVDVACWSLLAGYTEVFALDADGPIWNNWSWDRMSKWSQWHRITTPADRVRAIAATSRYGSGGGDSPGAGVLIAVTADGALYQGRHARGETRGADWPAWSQLP